jgi:hypothetical protein
MFLNTLAMHFKTPLLINSIEILASTAIKAESIQLREERNSSLSST